MRSYVLSGPLAPRTTESGFAALVRYGVDGRLESGAGEPGPSLTGWETWAQSEAPRYRSYWRIIARRLQGDGRAGVLGPVPAGAVPVPSPASLGIRMGRHSAHGQPAPSLLLPAP